MPEKLTSDKWKSRANQKWAARYDYSKVDYQGALEKIIILCGDHGPFVMLPSNHMAGSGCPQCGKEKMKGVVTLNFMRRPM